MGVDMADGSAARQPGGPISWRQAIRAAGGSLLEHTYVRIAGIVAESVVDGPGVRYVIFTQGCPFRCPGCHNPQSQPLTAGIEVKSAVLYAEIKRNPLIGGITFSGGEPFLQPDPLAAMARVLRAEHYSLWAYSGFVFEKLCADPQRRALLQCLDVVVDGPFVQRYKSLDLDFRGSSNQRIIDVQRSLADGRAVLATGFH